MSSTNNTITSIVNATLATAAPAPASTKQLPVSNFDRINFGILAAGFSLAMILKFGSALTTRRLRGNDTLAGFVIGCWFVYIVVQLVDMWVKRVQGPIPDFQWAIATVTILYSLTLCSVLHLSFIRSSALSGLASITRKRFEMGGYIFVGVVFVLRLVRTGIIFYQTSLSTANPGLSNNATTLQFASLLPTLGSRIILDSWSMYNLYKSRVKYVEQAGKEAFTIIQNSLIIEFILSVIATVVACQEAINTTGDRLAFMDWLLFSWCLASWVEQRPLYMLIFGSRLTTQSRSQSETGAEDLGSTSTAVTSFKGGKSQNGQDMEMGAYPSHNVVEPKYSRRRDEW
ncbi:hypothetical protein HDU96_007566 [Phlyctochytrium bullatum]|nr:hypothetical protein HDU96_007566 [Phlyctochytrium bullatum]